MKVLLVEDEPEMASALSDALGRHHVIVDHAETLNEAAVAVSSFPYDVIILDRKLPEGDGLTLLKRWRSAANAIPVLVLSARGSVDDRIEGLEGGADDYLTKPFDVSELFARLKALVRRPANLLSDKVTFGRLAFDYVNDEASVDGVALILTRRETLVLMCLLRRFGQVVQRRSLMEAVFSIDDEVQPNALDTHVSRLRHKLSDANSGLEVTGVRGVGYFLREST
ncbi:response regulator transcription factor [Pectobacterium carotovorum]|uniref:response regulator transcription factor n=1 Tax=Pectobacterium carotovorum TaxID=554 RepID=UPI0029D47383|nr:response regulator transcription factor [Pectobacterium carotovorum]MDX6914191.1 response regulator transcription factor [Pectobacterium carotovorum]